MHTTKQINEKGKSFFIITLSIYILLVAFGTLNLGSFGSGLRLIGLLPFLGWFLYSRRIKFNNVILLQTLLVMLFGISILYSFNIEKSIDRTVTNVLLLGLMVFFASGNGDLKKNRVLINSAIWSSRLTVLIVIMFSTYKENRLFIGGAFTEDPNYLTGYFLFGYVFALYEVLYGKFFIKKIFGFIEILIYVFIVVATGSRTGFITYLFITAIVFLGNFKFNRKTVLISISTLVFAIIAYIAITSLVNPEALSRLTFESIISSNGTGRFDLWDNALHIYSESSVFRKFFGYGSGSIRTVYTSYGFINQVSHNIFIEILLENGIIGLLVYTALIIKIVIMASQSSIKELLFILLGMIIISLGASLYAFKPYWNVILIILYFSSPNKHQNRIGMENLLRG